MPLRLCCDWLRANEEVLKSCTESSANLWRQLVTLVNAIAIHVQPDDNGTSRPAGGTERGGGSAGARVPRLQCAAGGDVVFVVLRSSLVRFEVLSVSCVTSSSCTAFVKLSCFLVLK